MNETKRQFTKSAVQIDSGRILRACTLMLAGLLVAGSQACPLNKDFEIGAQSSISPSPSETPTETPTDTTTVTPTDTPTDTATETPTETETSTDTATETPTDTPGTSALTGSSNGLISALSRLSDESRTGKNRRRKQPVAVSGLRTGSAQQRFTLGQALSGQKPDTGFKGAVPGLAADTDHDGVADWKEKETGYDPRDANSKPAPKTVLNSRLEGYDNDGDGLSNQEEEDQYGTDLNTADTDRDGVIDGAEILSGSDPLNPKSRPSPDRDGDGIDDKTELEYGINPEAKDTDRDRASDALELLLGSNPLSPDTDHDGFLDGFEFAFGSDPLDDSD